MLFNFLAGPAQNFVIAVDLTRKGYLSDEQQHKTNRWEGIEIGHVFIWIQFRVFWRYVVVLVFSRLVELASGLTAVFCRSIGKGDQASSVLQLLLLKLITCLPFVCKT